MTLRVLLLASLVLVPCVLKAQRERLPPKALAWVQRNYPNAHKTSTGIRYVVLEKGHGPKAERGDRVGVQYIGQLIDGTIFDQSPADDPLRFRVSRGRVIRGWDYIIQKMRLGSKWLVVIPPELAYGTRGSPPQISRNATLVFTMKLVELEPKK